MSRNAAAEVQAVHILAAYHACMPGSHHRCYGLQGTTGECWKGVAKAGRCRCKSNWSSAYHVCEARFGVLEGRERRCDGLFFLLQRPDAFWSSMQHSAQGGGSPYTSHHRCPPPETSLIVGAWMTQSCLPEVWDPYSSGDASASKNEHLLAFLGHLRGRTWL